MYHYSNTSNNKCNCIYIIRFHIYITQPFYPTLFQENITSSNTTNDIMDHSRYGQPAFTSGNNLPLHFHTPMPSLVSEVPFYLHQVQNPNAQPSHPFLDTTNVSPPPPPPSYSPQIGWNGLTSGGINLNHGTSNYVQSTTIRWPRQETLALLEIRSRLDPCFKEATSSNHKAPLWDEISRYVLFNGNNITLRNKSSKELDNTKL